LSEGLDPQGSYYALLGLKQQGEETLATWVVSYHSAPDPSANDFLTDGLSKISQTYPAKRKAEPRSRSLYILANEETADVPKLWYELAADAVDPSTIYLGGVHVGPVLCTLKALTNNLQASNPQP